MGFRSVIETRERLRKANVNAKARERQPSFTFTFTYAVRNLYNVCFLLTLYEKQEDVLNV